MDGNKDIDDALVVATLRKAVKNLSDARVEFEKGGRADLVAANDAEIRVLEKYLPKGIDGARLEALIDAAIAETGLPVVMHQGSGHDMLFYRGRGATVSNLLATQSMAPRTAGLLAMSGVLENHPDLHFVFVETNAAWIPGR